MGEPSPEQSQRKELGRREISIGRFQKMIHRLSSGMPLDFAVTESGGKLMEALLGAEDVLIDSRRLIRRETAPVVKKEASLVERS